MNFLLLNHAIALFLTSATAFMVGLFIFYKSELEKTKLANSLWYLSVAGWSFFHALFIIQDEPPEIISRLLWSFVLFIPVSTAHFVVSFLKIKNKEWLIRVGYIFAFLFVLISFTGSMGSDVQEIAYLKHYQKANVYIYFNAVIFFIYFLYQIIELFKAYRESTGIRNNQIAYVFWASVLGYLGGFSNYIIAFGYYIPIFNPFATYLLLFYTLLTPLAILKYQLMDIKLVIKRAFLYSVGISLISGFIVSISFLSDWLADSIPGFRFWTVPLIAGFVSFVVGVIFLNKLKEVDKLKYEFITVATHKLRTPLTEIKWAAAELRNKNLSDIDKEKLISEIVNADNKLIELTNELLSVSSVESARHKYNLELSSLEKIARSAVNSFQHQLRDKKIKLDYNFEKNLPDVNIDKNRIGSVIQSLMENAITYTKDEIKINIDVYKNNVIFHIEDNGIGVEKEDQGHIFSKFYRTHDAYLSETEGAGVGLFLAKSIIDKHNGKIGVRSEGKDKGSIFWFSLPMAG